MESEDQFNIIKYFNDGQYDFTGDTLLIPAVSVGNVGQLAIDLYLENCSPRPTKIGQVFHTGLEPVVGNGGGGNLMVACEIFHQPPQKLVILQFYSPVIKRHQTTFVAFLVNWIQQSKFGEILCLSSSLASLRNDLQLNAAAPRYLAGSSLNPARIQEIQSLGWLQLEARDNGGDPMAIPGGGIAHDLFIACDTVQIPILTLILFASDGDNTPESTALLRSLNQLIHLFPESSQLRVPSNWQYFNGSKRSNLIF